MPLLLDGGDGLHIGLAAETGLESCESGESRRGSSKATREFATPSRSCVTMCRAKALVTCRLASFTLPGRSRTPAFSRISASGRCGACSRPADRRSKILVVADRGNEGLTRGRLQDVMETVARWNRMVTRRRYTRRRSGQLPLERHSRQRALARLVPPVRRGRHEGAPRFLERYRLAAGHWPKEITR